MFVTLDGVMEAPENWVIADDAMFGAIETGYAAADALLLGRRTYEVFAASWPQRGSDIPNAEWMNTTPKIVASTTLDSPLEWQNSTLIEGDTGEAIGRLKQQDGKNIVVNGSATLVRSLLRDSLLDELRLFVHPVIVGSGERWFGEGDHVALELADSHAYANGVVSLTYHPAVI
jgi:dihydrofolate reductase